jgi:serine/threonine-protein kinase
MAYAQKGMYKEALDEYRIAVQASKGSALMRAEYASVLALSGDVDKARSELNDVLELTKKQYISAYQIATIYIALKDRELALQWLDKALDEGADWLVFLKVDPRFNSLRSDPKFLALQKRAGF